jgi:peroxiredoxin
MSLRTTLPWIVLLVGALTISYTFSPSRGIKVLVDAPKRVAAADFKLTDATGQEVQLSDYKDTVVLLNFWATWCGPCEVEMPWFKEFEQTYKDRGFAVLGVSTDEGGWTLVRAYMQAHNINYRVALDDGKMPAPYKDVEALPTSYLIDRQGRIAQRHQGLVAKDVYQWGVEQLLAQ